MTHTSNLIQLKTERKQQLNKDKDNVWWKRLLPSKLKMLVETSQIMLKLQYRFNSRRRDKPKTFTLTLQSNLFNMEKIASHTFAPRVGLLYALLRYTARPKRNTILSFKRDTKNNQPPTAHQNKHQEARARVHTLT